MIPLSYNKKRTNDDEASSTRGERDEGMDDDDLEIK
jgi:hypothetical protein